MAVESLRPSLIREVANAGFGLDGVLPFWFGESDRVTPAFIRDAVGAALARSGTFYTHNLGAAPLREALADYVSFRHGPTRAAQVAVTSASVSVLMLAAQLLVGAGDRVVAITPLWPNLVEIPKILGARVECVSLAFGEAGWRLDLERLLAALTPDTRMLFVNSPNNPTGWTLSAAEQAAILAHCRRRTLVPRSGHARRARDRGQFLLEGLGDDGLAARLAGGARAHHGRAGQPGRIQHLVRAGLRAGRWRGGGARGRAVRRRLRRVAAHRPRSPGGRAQCLARRARRGTGRRHVPLFLRLPGAADSLAFCKRLVREAGLGLAPGRAFGDEGEGFVRWCYACDVARLDAGVERLRRFLQGAGG